MLSKDIRCIMKENEKYTRVLAEYDRTGVFLLDKTRRTFSIRNATLNKLKEESEKTGKSMSAIIDTLVENDLGRPARTKNVQIDPA